MNVLRINLTFPFTASAKEDDSSLLVLAMVLVKEKPWNSPDRKEEVVLAVEGEGKKVFGKKFALPRYSMYI